MATPAVAPDVSALEELLLQMWRIRSFELRAMQLFEEKLIRGSVHPYIGMEAIAVGACAALRPSDYITSTHRGHGHCIAKNLELRLMMAEILGREAGYCRGKGGSMHITAVDHGMLGADAIVCGSSAIAVGAAHGLRIKGEDGVVVCFFGDGASNQGLFHEAANLAAVLAAPVVFVCENNQWAISTPVAAATRIPDIAARAASYGFPGVVADGNDVLEMRTVTKEAAARAGERARHVEVPLQAVGVRRDEVDRDTRAADPRVLGDDRELGLLQHLLRERLRGFAFASGTGLKAALEVELGDVGRRHLVTRM